MKTKVNLSQTVKVRLTDYGIRVLKMQDEIINNSTFDFFKQRLLATGKEMPILEEKVTPLVVDKDGYTEFELKDLMERFATHLDYKNPPYDSDIVVEEVTNNIVIPDFIAECIEFIRNSTSLRDALQSVLPYESEEVNDWLLSEEHQELFANAWINGYVISD